MKNILLYIFTIIVVSLYFFPFELKAFVGLNTKMGLAAIGLLLYGWSIVTKREIIADKNLFYLSVLAALVSFIGFFSVSYNHTPDYAYASYLVSMLVWLSAAYTVCFLIKAVHGSISIWLICNYLITVCVIQCVLALVIDMSMPVKIWVDGYIAQGSVFLNEVNRLYGIGASLDVAGSRFAAVLIMIGIALIHLDKTRNRKYFIWYVLAFLVISVVGNMMARTTFIGLAIALLYLLYSSKFHLLRISASSKRFWIWTIVLLILLIPVVTYYYNTVPEVYMNIRFAFEGFFNWVEKGEWSIASNEKLKTMYVYPETFKTWIIGDGYFSNPEDVDANYMGPMMEGYYMGTDVGYLRFIFYFGIIGLSVFSYFMFYAGKSCMQKFPQQKILFILLLVLGFAVWFKVSTDIFLIFALLLLVDKDENDIYNNRIGLYS